MGWVRCGSNIISVPITENGTAFDYDVWNGISATKTNFNNIHSDYCLYNGNIVEEMYAYLQGSSGYEGFCFKCKEGLNLTVSESYVLSFVLDVANTVTFNATEHKFGIKHSNSQISNFNTSTDQEFTRQTGRQNISFTFTADTNNYFSFIASCCAGSGVIRFIDIKITSVT